MINELIKTNEFSNNGIENSINPFKILSNSRADAQGDVSMS